MKPLNTCLYILVNNLVTLAWSLTHITTVNINNPFALSVCSLACHERGLAGSRLEASGSGANAVIPLKVEGPRLTSGGEQMPGGCRVAPEGKMAKHHFCTKALGREDFSRSSMLVLNLCTLPKISDASCASSLIRKGTYAHTPGVCRQRFYNCLKFVYRP